MSAAVVIRRDERDAVQRRLAATQAQRAHLLQRLQTLRDACKAALCARDTWTDAERELAALVDDPTFPFKGVQS